MLSLSTNGGDNLSVSSSSQSHSQLQVNKYENTVPFTLLQVSLIKSDACFCQFSHDAMSNFAMGTILGKCFPQALVL